MERRSIAEWEREFGIQYQTLVYVARRAKIHQGKSRGSGMVLLTREQAESLLPQVEALEELRWRKRSCYSGARFGKLKAYCDLLDVARPRIEVVYNAHPTPEQGCGGWGDHRAVYLFPLSDAWKRWTAAARSHGLSVSEFAQLLEDGVADIADPAARPEVRLQGVTFAAPNEVLKLAEGLSIRVDQKVVEQRRRDNGTATLAFTETHAGEKGEPLSIPNGFLLGIPVFVGGDSYAVRCRLRYRVQQGQVLWTVVLHDAEESKRDAMTDAAKRFESETHVPLFYGTPEGAQTSAV